MDPTDLKITTAMLYQGALILTFFEYLFYWCVILTLAAVLNWIRTNLHKNPTTSGQV